ncbi:MAG: hypothetical protein ACXWZP_05145 [Gaiellaceae bacterium]
MSHRARRRLMWIVVAGGFAASLAFTAVFFWNTAENIETFSGGKADIYVAPKPHKLTKVERAALVSVAQRFVESAVARDRPERAFEIVGPDLRGSLSRKQWATGEIPVVPYPVASARWKVEYSNAEAVGLLVMVFPPKGARERPTVFSMSMVPVRLGADSRWLVNGWVPKGGSPTTIGSSSDSPGQALADVASQQAERVSPRASVAWLIVPVVLICLVFVVPVVFLVRERRVARRMRRYLDSRA